MTTYRDQAIAEKAELDARLATLENFLDGEAFRALSYPQIRLLVRQHGTMQAYAQILQDRIDTSE